MCAQSNSSLASPKPPARHTGVVAGDEGLHHRGYSTFSSKCTARLTWGHRGRKPAWGQTPPHHSLPLWEVGPQRVEGQHWPQRPEASLRVYRGPHELPPPLSELAGTGTPRGAVGAHLGEQAGPCPMDDPVAETGLGLQEGPGSSPRVTFTRIPQMLTEWPPFPGLRSSAGGSVESQQAGPPGGGQEGDPNERS